jgi:signal transduction histidine kinase
MRKERSLLPEPSPASPREEQEVSAAAGPALRVSIFESELDPFRLSLLDSGHFVLYRKVWRDGARSIQGALIEQDAFLRGTVEAAFRDTVLSRMSDLAVAYRGAILAAFGARTGREYRSSAAELTGDLLYRARLSTPASDLELIFSIRRLPAGPGARVLAWTAAALVLVLVGGFLFMERLGRRQIALARQQQDFVSAVSHELKTPLTSIRMYSEMLREGWADEGRKRTYYAFICEESERLTRLIENVLQLARLTRNELRVGLKPTRVGELMETLRPKIANMTERAGFVLDLDCTECAELAIRVDEDFLTQILINLVDNAVKFARDAEHKAVRIDCHVPEHGQVRLSVRDYGPGVPRDQMKKIFELFYRSGNELTRETVGTGIGLALVRELTLAMGGRIDLVNARPGAEFRLTFPVERHTRESQ